MKLPSLNLIISKSSIALRRFPMVIASAAIAVIASIYLVEFNNEIDNESTWLALILVSALGISFFFVLKLIGEKLKWDPKSIWGINILGIGILIGYYFLLPEDLNTAPEAFIYRYILYFLVSHLLVAIGPYWSRGEMSAFWQYNKTLFLRFLTAVLFSAVLYIGLVIALGSIDVLLNVDIDSKRYFELFLLIGGLFNTWFFVSGIPEPIKSFSKIDDYPKGLKVFTQNILIPLVTIYVIILYLYTGKIILEWSWPEGWVAYLVLSFSIVGIFALLLLHPIQEKVENRWIKKFSRSYFITLVPLVILLLLAIWRRIWEYSFTVNRYFVLVLGLWLAGIVAYFIISKTKNIKVIPASLGVIAFLISFGPWSAFSISEQSQKDRLENYLVQHEILMEGTIQKATEPVPFEDRKEISSILRYLNSMHGLKSIEQWFEEDLTTRPPSVAGSDTTQPVNRYQLPQHVTERMGIEYVNQWEASPDDMPQRSYSSKKQKITAIGSYDWMVSYHYPQPGFKDMEIKIGNDSLSIRTDPEQAWIKLFSNVETADTLLINLDPMIRELRQNYNASNSYNIPATVLKTESSNDWINAVLYFENLNMGAKEDKSVIHSFDGRLFLEFKE